MARLTAEERTTCIPMDQLGYTRKVIADRIGRSQNAVSLAIRHRQDTGSPEDRPRSGRPRISTDRDVRHLVRQSLTNKKATVPELRGLWQGHGVIASNTTVGTRLMDAGLNARVARKKH